MKQTSLKAPFRYERPNYDNASGSTKKKREKVANPGAVVKRLWSYLTVKKGLLAGALLMIVISSVFMLVSPIILGNIIDGLTNQTFSREELLFRLLLLFFVYAIVAAATFFQGYWMVKLSQYAVYDLRSDLFLHLQKLRLAFFDKRQHGELMSRMTNDIDNISTTMNTSIVQILSSLITFTGIISVMIWYSPLLTLVTIITIPVMFAGVRWITRRTRSYFRYQQQAVSAVNGFAEENISGKSIIKVFSRENAVTNAFYQRTAELQQSGFWAQTFSGFIPKWMNMLNNISFALIAGVGAILIFHGAAGITIGTVVIFLEYSRQFTRPLNELANQFNSLFSALAGAERVFEIMDEPTEKALEGNEVMENIKGEIQFDEVSFAYEDEQTLESVNFTIPAGSMAAFVGPTGSGKTTIMNLIAAFYRTTVGQIRIDGVPIHELNLDHYRSQIGVVLQQDFLFKGTIMENIRYGRLNATDEEVMQAAKEANAHPFIVRLPNGYQTEIKQDGGGLSQGQRQLLSIAKALLADPKILILDEATSSVDTITELRIQEALAALMKNRTSVVVAHRLNTIRQADTIFVLDEGRIIEHGNHLSLMKQNGFYYRLHEGKQMKQVSD